CQVAARRTRAETERRRVREVIGFMVCRHHGRTSSPFHAPKAVEDSWPKMAAHAPFGVAARTKSTIRMGHTFSCAAIQVELGSSFPLHDEDFGMGRRFCSSLRPYHCTRAAQRIRFRIQ